MPDLRRLGELPRGRARGLASAPRRRSRARGPSRWLVGVRSPRGLTVAASVPVVELGAIVFLVSLLARKLAGEGPVYSPPGWRPSPGAHPAMLLRRSRPQRHRGSWLARPAPAGDEPLDSQGPFAAGRSAARCGVGRRGPRRARLPCRPPAGGRRDLGRAGRSRPRRREVRWPAVGADGPRARSRRGPAPDVRVPSGHAGPDRPVAPRSRLLPHAGRGRFGPRTRLRRSGLRFGALSTGRHAMAGVSVVLGAAAMALQPPDVDWRCPWSRLRGARPRGFRRSTSSASRPLQGEPLVTAPALPVALLALLLLLAWRDRRTSLLDFVPVGSAFVVATVWRSCRSASAPWRNRSGRLPRASPGATWRSIRSGAGLSAGRGPRPRRDARLHAALRPRLAGTLVPGRRNTPVHSPRRRRVDPASRPGTLVGCPGAVGLRALHPRALRARRGAEQLRDLAPGLRPQDARPARGLSGPGRCRDGRARAPLHRHDVANGRRVQRREGTPPRPRSVGPRSADRRWSSCSRDRAPSWSERWMPASSSGTEDPTSSTRPPTGRRSAASERSGRCRRLRTSRFRMPSCSSSSRSQAGREEAGPGTGSASGRGRRAGPSPGFWVTSASPKGGTATYPSG